MIFDMFLPVHCIRSVYASCGKAVKRSSCRQGARNLLLLGILLLIAVVSLSAQNVGKLSGVVKDAESGEPLIGCNITIIGTTIGASTDAEGIYFILNIPPGKYDVQSSIIGYQRMVQRGVVVNSGRTTTIDFRLYSEALVQQEVVIQATRPDVEPEKTSTSAIIRPEEITSVAGVRDVGDVLQLAADVTDGHFRGGRTGEEFYTLQGMGIVNPLNNSTAFMPIMSAVEEVEVITSGFGAQYGNAQSGVVNISMKEGRSDKWRTKVETRMRAPGRKHFGPSIYDPGANPYLALLLEKDTWLQGDPQTNTPYYGSMGSGLKDRFGGDTVVLLQVAQTLWRMQTKRDLYRDYGKDIDYSVEASTGGPVDENIRMFLALRRNIVWPVFPTELPDIQYQIMSNIASDVGKGASLRISGGFTEDNGSVFPSSSSLGYYNWLWDRITAINYQKRTNLQLGARFSQTLSPSTFYEIKLNSLWTKRKVGSTPSPSSVADSLIVNDLNYQIDWDKIIPQTVKSPDEFYYLRGDDIFRDELTRTLSAEASITSQVTKSHLLNGGFQLNSYNLDISNYLSVRDGAGGAVELYEASPFEGAIYAQDKMEFKGMIANVGLRFDVWSSQSDYYTSLFNPYRVVDSLGNPTNDPDAASKEKAPILGRLQPRVGVSFPVSVGTVFHLNYGAFMQRPSFQYIVSSRVQQAVLRPIRLGNPTLKPETTNSYDIGVMQGLGEGFTLDISGYYKDVKNLVELAVFTSDQSYETYFNRDYADIRGFRIALTKKRGAFTGSANYQFSVATGKSATTSNAPPTFVKDPLTGEIITKLDKVPVRDIPLNFDRTHNLILNLAYETGDDVIKPFQQITISTSSFFRSGRPYTSSRNTKLINGARTPAELNTNAKLIKKIPDFFGTSAFVYLEVFNLFNNKILNYDYIFSTPDAGSTNNRIKFYEEYAIDDRQNGILYWQDTNIPSQAFAVDQSFLIYDNAPRSFNLGFVVEF
jgi:outer membrane receptor protein involved in Fe transport